MEKLAILGGAPVLDTPLAPYHSLGQDEVKAVNEVMEDGLLSGFMGAPGDAFYGGPRVRALEEQWADRFSIKHAVSVNSATSGLIAAMGAVGVSPGDEVILPPYTMSATVMAPLFYGGIPVFVDIDEDTFCLDIDAVRTAITPKTRAIFAVNLFGHPAPLAALRTLADEHGIYLVEDNAQAPLAHENGRLTGTVGHIGVFSLNRHKHIQTGEGGMCTTDDDDLATRLQLIRNHGENIVNTTSLESYENIVGFNFRLTELSAAIALCQLARADEIVDEREDRANRLTSYLNGINGLTTPRVKDGCRHTYYIWAAKMDAESFGAPREVVVEAIRQEGVSLNQGYVKPLYKLPLFQNKVAIGRDGFPFTSGTTQDYHSNLCPTCDIMFRKKLFWLGICDYQLSAEETDRVGAAIAKVFENRKALSEAYNSGQITLP